MATLALADKLSVELCKLSCDDVRRSSDQKSAQPLWRVDSDKPSIPSGEGNICFRAAKRFFEHLGIDPSSVSLSVFIEKSIPDAAGLGGGSADAAAVLRFLFQNRELLCRWFGLDAASLSLSQLERIALSCGADVPFCLYGGIRLCEGVGEVMTPLPSLTPISVLLATPVQFVVTKTAFHMIDQLRKDNEKKTAEFARGEARPPGDVSSLSPDVRDGSPCREEVDSWKEAIPLQSLQVLEPLIHNDFVPVIARSIDRVEQLLDALKATGAPIVSMSGSGPTCFALYRDRDDCESACAVMSSRFPGVRFIRTAVDSTPELL